MDSIKLLLPKRRAGDNAVIGVRFTSSSTPGERVYFLAGPIRGADDWQAEAIKLLHQKDPSCYIACPRRYEETHELYQFSLDPPSDGLRTAFFSQTMWERNYLEMAAERGAIIFWLPGESKTDPRKKEDGPYARDTYGELGRWSVMSARAKRPAHSRGQEKVNLVIGAEKEFPGLSVIKKNFDADHEGSGPFSFYSSLEETIAEAVRLGKKTNPQPFWTSENC